MEEETINQGREDEEEVTEASPQRHDATAPNQTSCALPDRDLGAIEPLVLPSASPSPNLAECLLAHWGGGRPIGRGRDDPPSSTSMPRAGTSRGGRAPPGSQGTRAHIRGGTRWTKEGGVGGQQHSKQKKNRQGVLCSVWYGVWQRPKGPDRQGSRRALVSSLRVMGHTHPARLESTSSDPKGSAGARDAQHRRPIVCGPKSPNRVGKGCS